MTSNSWFLTLSAWVPDVGNDEGESVAALPVLSASGESPVLARYIIKEIVMKYFVFLAEKRKLIDEDPKSLLLKSSSHEKLRDCPIYNILEVVFFEKWSNI
jgi:hypothetical protein